MLRFPHIDPSDSFRCFAFFIDGVDGIRKLTIVKWLLVCEELGAKAGKKIAFKHTNGARHSERESHQKKKKVPKKHCFNSYLNRDFSLFSKAFLCCMLILFSFDRIQSPKISVSHTQRHNLTEWISFYSSSLFSSSLPITSHTVPSLKNSHQKPFLCVRRNVCSPYEQR